MTKNNVVQAPEVTASSFSKVVVSSFEEIPLLDRSHRSDAMHNTLRRVLSFSQCFSMVVTGLIGSGVFISPSLVAKHVPNMAVGFCIWIIAGGIALMGSLCYCELTSLIQKTGSSYVFVYEAYGKIAGFLVIWINAAIVIPCSFSVVIFTSGMYAAGPFFQDKDSASFLWAARFVGLAAFYILVIITASNVKASGKVSMALNCLQMLVLVLILGVAIWYAIKNNDCSNLTPKVMFNNTLEGITAHPSDLGTALFNALWCFDGWYMLSTFVEEVKNPKKTIPMIAFTSIPFITFVYVTINIACLLVLNQSQMAATEIVFQTLMEEAVGKRAAAVIPIMVTISCLAGLTSPLYILPRFMLSAAREGQMPEIFSLIHKNWRTPIPAIIYVTVMASVMTLLGKDLEQVMLYCNIAIWVEYGIAISAVLAFRRKYPGKHRFYRVWITTPIIMLFISIGLVIAFAFRALIPALVIIGVICLGFPVYYVCLYKEWLSFLKLDKLTEYICKKTSLVKCDYAEIVGDNCSSA